MADPGAREASARYTLSLLPRAARSRACQLQRHGRARSSRGLSRGPDGPAAGARQRHGREECAPRTGRPRLRRRTGRGSEPRDGMMPDLPAHLRTGASARRLAGRLGAAALLLASLSCRDAVAPAPRPVQPEVPEAIDCASHGTDHSGSVESDTWKRNGSPHRLHGAVTVTGSLTIEPGSIVCGSTGSQLLVGTAATGSHGVLLARGTVDAPIVFTASDSAVRWGGILLADSAADRVSVLVHAVLQHATRGILADGAVQVDSSRFRQ